MKTPLLIVGAIAALATPALGQTTPPATPQQQAEQTAQDVEAERVRCRNVFVVNSRIPERICRTNAEWARIQRETREALDRNQRGAGASGDNTGS
jgi:hypothetical protein